MRTSARAITTAGARSRALYAILAGGFVAGVLDITDAFVVWGLKDVPPSRVLQGVASGLLGRAAHGGGLPIAALGALLHFFISFSAAAAYCVASLATPVLDRYAAPFGIAYGGAFYLVMTYVVVPLSAFPASAPMALTANGWFAHTVLFGLPIALASRFFQRRHVR